MTIPEVDHRNLGRREREHELAKEPQLPPLDIPHVMTPLLADEDDDLLNELIETNASFREMAERSKASPRKPFDLCS